MRAYSVFSVESCFDLVLQQHKGTQPVVGLSAVGEACTPNAVFRDQDIFPACNVRHSKAHMYERLSSACVPALEGMFSSQTCIWCGV